MLTFRQLRNKCTSAIRKAISDHFLNLIPKSKSSISFSPLATANGYSISDRKEICVAFNRRFASAGNLLDEICAGPPLSAIDPVTHAMAKPCFSLHPFSLDDVPNALLSMNSRNSVGEDKLDPYFLKLAAPFVVTYITYF